MKKYSIVCYLEGESKQKIRDIQNNLFEMTGARACLDAWDPHITLGDGVEVSDDESLKLEMALENFVKDQKVFEIDLQDYSIFGIKCLNPIHRMLRLRSVI